MNMHGSSASPAPGFILMTGMMVSVEACTVLPSRSSHTPYAASFGIAAAPPEGLADWAYGALRQSSRASSVPTRHSLWPLWRNHLDGGAVQSAFTAIGLLLPTIHIGIQLIETSAE